MSRIEDITYECDGPGCEQQEEARLASEDLDMGGAHDFTLPRGWIHTRMTHGANDISLVGRKKVLDGHFCSLDCAAKAITSLRREARSLEEVGR